MFFVVFFFLGGGRGGGDSCGWFFVEHPLRIWDILGSYFMGFLKLDVTKKQGYYNVK